MANNRNDDRYRDDYSRGQQGGYGDDRWRQGGSSGSSDRGRYGQGGGYGQQRGERFGGDFSSGNRVGRNDEDYGLGQSGGFDEGERGYGSRGGYRGGDLGGRSSYSSGTGFGGGFEGRDEWTDRSGGAFSDADYGQYGSNSRSSRGGWPGRSYGGSGRGNEQGGRDFWDKASDEVSSWFGDEDAERRRRMDEHRGRGPKSYTRSDDRIKEDINDRLTDDGQLDASDIDVSVSSREVTLSGKVDSRSAKRRAEDIAESVSGVTHVQNNLRVRSQDASYGSAGTGETTGIGGSSIAQTGGAVGSSATGKTRRGGQI